MFVSTREMLSQVDDRSKDTAVIEKHCGPLKQLDTLLDEPTLGPLLAELGPEALSDKALRMLARKLQETNQASR
jgi:hypothetical protein